MNKNLITTHVLDTNIFIQAYRFYPEDIFPGVWKLLGLHASSGRIVTVDRVLDELSNYKDDPYKWVRKRGKAFTASTKDDAVIDLYREIMTWVEGNPVYTRENKDKFAQGADGWLIAFAKAYGLTVVTEEVLAAETKTVVKIPNVCNAVGVDHTNTFGLLRELRARFDWDEA